MSPQPPKEPMWTCGNCQTSNESFRRKCRNCQASKPKPKSSGTARSTISRRAGSAATKAMATRTGHDAPPDAEPVPAPPRGSRRPKRHESSEESAARRAAAIQRIVEAAPPLTPQQIVGLRRILAPPQDRHHAA